MNVIVVIQGREAIPVRALSFVTLGLLSPDEIAIELAQAPGSSRTRRFRAYQLQKNGSPTPIYPNEWDQVLVNLLALKATLFNEQAQGDIGRAAWQRQAPLILPAGCFVWRKEFERAIDCREDFEEVAADKRSSVRSRNFSPLVPDDLKEALLEGFQLPESSGTNKWPWGDYETPLLQALAKAAVEWQKWDRSTPAPKNEAIIALVREQWDEKGNPISNNVAQKIATILRSPSVPDGPRTDPRRAKKGKG